MVLVSPCTCDLFTTTSEQIASLLNDCWNLEVNSIVPVWLFDTGLNPKRKKQLRLLLVDRHTAFPIGATTTTPTTRNLKSSPLAHALSQPILISELNMPKNPDNDKRVTFTLDNGQLVCLIQFYDFTSCQEFYKFFTDICDSPKNDGLFRQQQNELLMDDQKKRSKCEKRFSFMRSSKSHSQSLLSLSKMPAFSKPSSVSSNQKSKRYSEIIDSNVQFNVNVPSSSSGIKSSQTWANLRELGSSHGFARSSRPDLNSEATKTEQAQPRVRITGITKNCISSPCAFQHINSIKDGDQRVKMLLDYKL